MKTVDSIVLLTLSLVLSTACGRQDPGQDSSQTLANTTAADDRDSEENKDKIITDYALTPTSILVLPDDRKPLGKKQPVKLVIKGSVQKDGKTLKVSDEVSGISVPLDDSINARLYLLLVREGDVIYTEQKDMPVARVNARNELITDQAWNWTLTYREYRYTFHDQVSALMFGTLVKNQEAIFADADPKGTGAQSSQGK